MRNIFTNLSEKKIVVRFQKLKLLPLKGKKSSTKNLLEC